MKGKNIIFFFFFFLYKFLRQKSKNKMNFKKKKKVFKIDDVVNKILVIKKNHTLQRKHLNTLLDIMIMI